MISVRPLLWPEAINLGALIRLSASRLQDGEMESPLHEKRSWPLRTARMGAPHAARLFVAERAHRLDARGAVGGDDVSQDADGYEEQSDGGEREWVRGTDTED